MWRKRKNNPLAISQRPRCELLIVTICAVCLTPFHASGQKTPDPASAPIADKSCEGKPPAQASTHQAATESGTERLVLPTKAVQASSEAQGQFCRRERPDQNSLRPSLSTDQPAAVPETSQPPSPPPIAQMTDGKLTIRANGQEFASVLESVRSATGVTVEMPALGTSDPVYLNFGPANVRDALVALLDGTNYNYILVGSEQDSRAVKRLILTQRSSAGTLVASTQAPPVASHSPLPDNDSEASEPPLPIQPAVNYSSVPTGIDIRKLAAESGKAPGEILDELQKRQLQVLDDQAASQPQPTPQQ